MIEVAPYLRNRYQRILPQYQYFLDSINAVSGQYSIAPHLEQGGMLVAVYQPEDFDVYSYKTDVRITVGSSETSFTTGLDSALYITAEVFADKALFGSLAAAGQALSEQAVLAHYGIEPEVKKSKVAAWMTGTFIAPDLDGYACFSVDTHGEVSIEARSVHLAGVAFYLAAWRHAEAANLSARIAQFARDS